MKSLRESVYSRTPPRGDEGPVQRQWNASEAVTRGDRRTRDGLIHSGRSNLAAPSNGTFLDTTNGFGDVHNEVKT